MYLHVVLLLLCALESACHSTFLRPKDEPEVSVDYLFGENAQYFTVCQSVACCVQTLESPVHAEKLMLFIPTVHVDGDSYLSYYLGLVFDSFVTAAAEARSSSGRGNSDSGDKVHILVLSISHAMEGGPYDDSFIIGLVRACNNNDFSFFTSDNCTSFTQLISAVDVFSHDGRMFHKNLVLLVLNDAVIMTAYVDIALKYSVLHDEPLFAIMHLNHEQPWLDNQQHNTSIILQAYSKTRLVFRTHYYAPFLKLENVHYLALGAGLLETESMALALPPHLRRFPPTDQLRSWGPPSQREWLCSFAGSMKYKNRGGGVESSRAEMLEVLTGVPGCKFFPTDDTSRQAPLTQTQYVKLTMGSIFSLCPRGVGPETNRPHQALELGAIPIMVREADSEKDFLVMWHGYPGPVFSSWLDAKSFLQDVSTGRISIAGITELQEDLSDWFSGFQRRQRAEVWGAVQREMEQRDARKANTTSLVDHSLDTSI
mmetsp:Transcript_21050/g.35503  ORF Transcript_21050/g.35503 Transcript_21050/m.35503 type:complete len:484 (+) Transcript_21050:42-1493(+)